VRAVLVAVALVGASLAIVAAAAPVAGTTPAVTAVGPDGVAAFGRAATVPAPSLPLGAGSITAIAATPDGGGYWLATATGHVYAAGDATAAATGLPAAPVAPVVGIAPAGRATGGYWLAGADGGVFALGGAPFLGSAAGVSSPVVGIAADPGAPGYWLVTGDGRVFSFGGARYHGGASRLAAPVVGIAATPDGGGYWLVSADGGIFAFGDAPFAGSLGGRPLAAPVVGIAATPDGAGYWVLGADGGVFTFGDAPFLGSAAGSQEVVAGIAGRAGGYWVAAGRNPFGPVMAADVAGRTDTVTAAVYDVTTGETFTFRPGLVEHTASTVKLDILATLLQEAQAANRPLTADEQADAVPMIEESLDSAADDLWTEVGGAPAVARLEGDVGLSATTPATDGVWGRTTTTALDRLAMVRAVEAPNAVLTDASRAYILNLMEHVTPSQDWGATGGVPADVTVALKNGFAPIDDGWQINTEGWVDGQGRDYLIAVLTSGNPTEVYGIQTIDQISSLVWNAMG
jgi:hypothetical protein